MFTNRNMSNEIKPQDKKSILNNYFKNSEILLYVYPKITNTLAKMERVRTSAPSQAHALCNFGKLTIADKDLMWTLVIHFIQLSGSKFVNLQDKEVSIGFNFFRVKYTECKKEE